MEWGKSMKYVNQIHYEEIGLHERLQLKLSAYPVKIVNKDSSITLENIKDSYFLVSDRWNIGFFGEIEQFEKVVDTYKGTNHDVHFGFKSPSVNLEIKFVWYHKLFQDEWTLTTAFSGQVTHLRRVTSFINEKYPTLHSLLDLDIEKVEREWLFWLNNQGIQTKKTSRNIIYGEYTHKTPTANFLRMIYTNFFRLTDIREEWEKDRWDVRILYDRYGVDYNKSKSNYYIDFAKIDQINIRQRVKKYIKVRLLSKSNFSWSTARHYLRHLPVFLSFVFSLEPTWVDLKYLKRTHMEQFIQWLHKYAKNNLKQKNAHPESYVYEALKITGKFLEDIQRYEYDIAPETHVQLLLFPEDKPKLQKKSVDQIDYIPDYVLEQLFIHINELHKDVIPVVWATFKTGLRIDRKSVV